jgi:hypothetical protein
MGEHPRIQILEAITEEERNNCYVMSKYPRLFALYVTTATKI